ncbi:MAG TPA: hypothetical protein VFK04_02220 [Gemmatimonadaceae bacterium]|nr:hypothetical protein [Gemmatimonadaceae bacterium]
MRLSGLAALTIALAACGGSDSTSPQPQVGSIVVATPTTGHDLDSDGYSITVDEHSARPVAANDSVRIDSVLAGSHSITLSDYAGNCHADTTRVTVDVTVGMATRASFHLGCVPTRLHDRIVYSTGIDEHARLISIDPDGSDPERITWDQLDYLHPSVSADGRQIAFLSLPSDVIGIMNADGTGVRLLPTPRNFDGNPVWSPDGSALAFRSELPGPYGDYGRIFVINADGTGLRQVSPETADFTYDDSPSWSPDGSRILFSRNGQGYTVNVDGTGLHSLGTECQYGAWSPDGSRVACTATVSANMDVYLVSADGTNSFRLTTYADQDEGARWSPDGTRLVFMRLIDGHFQLVRINSDGTGEVQLTNTTSHTNSPWWAW